MFTNLLFQHLIEENHLDHYFPPCSTWDLREGVSLSVSPSTDVCKKIWINTKSVTRLPVHRSTAVGYIYRNWLNPDNLVGKKLPVLFSFAKVYLAAKINYKKLVNIYNFLIALIEFIIEKLLRKQNGKQSEAAKRWILKSFMEKGLDAGSNTT